LADGTFIRADGTFIRLISSLRIFSFDLAVLIINVPNGGTLTMITSDEKLINDAELCQWLGISRNTARAWRKAGKLKFLKTPGGRGIRYRERYVHDLLRRGELAARTTASRPVSSVESGAEA
jgi:excisionase family DNA binding protein